MKPRLRRTGFRNNGLEISVYYGAILELTQPDVALALQWEDLMVTALPVSTFVAWNVPPYRPHKKDVFTPRR
jgi:hypothetical protein